MPIQIITEPKVTEAYPLQCRMVQRPIADLIFGQINRRRERQDDIMQCDNDRGGYLLQLSSHATPIESKVFMLQSGVNPKKIPMANPRAIECGVSSMEIQCSWCAATNS